MTRLAYGALWLLAVPLVLARLAWRARKVPGYLERVGERFGRYDPAPPGPRIWVHAVSVGETRAAAIVIDALARRFPGHRILLTHMTPTGRATGIELFGDRVERAWLPYDLGFATRRFFARLSERSARRYARFPAIARWALGNLSGIAAQTAADAKRFEALGAPPPVVTGNVKFDLEVPPGTAAQGLALRERFGARRALWLAGSTREGEEALLLDAFVARGQADDALLAIVPRHPQRFDEVARLAAARGLRIARRSDPQPAGRDVRVIVGDSMGEMLAYYAAADVVLMGGSFLEFGSQNLIEPCALGKPVIVGPHTFNFEQAAAGAIAAGAALRVADAAAALAAASALSADAARRARMGEAALGFVAAHRGAADRLGAWLEATLAASRGRARG